MDQSASLMAKALPRPKRTTVRSPRGDDPGNLTETSPSPEETARYIAAFSAELSALARKAKLHLLAYLLDMARLEASRLSKDDPS